MAVPLPPLNLSSNPVAQSRGELTVTTGDKNFYAPPPSASVSPWLVFGLVAAGLFLMVK